MEEILIYLATMILTWLLGVLSKKSKFVSNNLIPVQNLCIGCVIALIDWYFTKDFSIALAGSGLLAGGTYDLIHNLNKIINKDKVQTTFNDEDLESIDTEGEEDEI